LSLVVRVVEKWAWPTFFTAVTGNYATDMPDLKADIQRQLTELDSNLDLVALEQPGTDSLRLFIDHPDGVDLALCERVTYHLNDLRVDYALEVSSPGPKYRRQSTPESKESSQ
jgi:hypothetical protein